MTASTTGDLQQAASEWTYSSAFPTRAQAEAAAGMALLFGMTDQPTYQRLSPQEKQAARDAPLDILGAAFGVTDRGDPDAHRHAALSTGALAPGMARAAVDAAGLQDPREAATSVPARVEAAHGTLGERSLDAGRVTEAAERHRDSVANAAVQTTTESRGARAAWLADHAPQPPVLLFAAKKDKDLDAVLRPLAARALAVVCTRPDVGRAAAPADLAHAASRWCPRVEARAPIAEALAAARGLAGSTPGAFVLVAGSLYLVGEVLRIVEGLDGPAPVAM